MKYLILALALALAGCAQLPANPTEMSPEQLREWIRDKNAAVSCGRVNTPWGPQTFVYWNVDNSKNLEGTLIVKPDCETSYTNSKGSP